MTDKFFHPFMLRLLSHPSSFGSFSSYCSIYFLRKQHYMHPFNKLPVLCLNSYIYGVMAVLCFEWITTVIKIVAWEKSLYLFELKKNKSIARFFGVCAFVLSATELMKSSSDYVIVAFSTSIHSSFPIEYFLQIFS